jgi:hypothetical protein
LVSKLFSVQAIRIVREGIDTSGNRTLVGQVSRYPSLVLGVSPTNKGGVIDQTILGSVSLGFQGSEEGLFGTQDLYRRGRSLGQVCKRTSLYNNRGEWSE